MSTELRIELNRKKIALKVTNDRLGKIAAVEWKRVIDPYTPRDTGNMMNNVSFSPFRIIYKSKYAHRQYYGRDFKFQKKNPYSTYKRDKAAEQAGQKDKLCRTLNNALKSGQY